MLWSLHLLLARLVHCYRYAPLVRYRRGRFLRDCPTPGGGLVQPPFSAYSGSLSFGEPFAVRAPHVRRYRYGFDHTLYPHKRLRDAYHTILAPLPRCRPTLPPIVPYGA